MRPPATLWEFDAADTLSRRRADVTWRAPTPLTRRRTNGCFTGLPSTSRMVLVPYFVVGGRYLDERVGGLTRPVVDDGRGVAGVAVRDEELGMVEGCRLEADPVVGERLQEGDEIRPLIGLADQGADAVDRSVEVGDVGIGEVTAPGVELHDLIEGEHAAVVHVGGAQLDVAERGRLERAVDGEDVGRADDREGILDRRDLGDGEPEEVTPGKGERDPRGVRAAHAQVLGGGPHAGVEETAVVERVRA